MKRIRIYGHRDDCMEIDGQAPGCDEYSGDDGRFLVTGTGGRFVVVVQYSPDGNGGTWRIGTELLVEEDQFPAWPIRFEPEHAYSHALVIEGPDDVAVARLGNK